METISFYVELEERWEILQKGITKVINIIEGVPDESPMDADYWMYLYTTVYSMCSQMPPLHGHSEKLYERYAGVYNDYLQSRVLPAIQEKQDDASMLQELVKRWANHKVLVSKLSRVFSYLDSKYVHREDLPSLKDVGFSCFRKIVYENVKVKVKHVVIALINQERQGNEIDRTLVKNVLEVFVEIGSENAEDKLNFYVNDFETAFVTDMVDYYTRNGSNEITAEECFQKEKDRISHYLHFSTEERVLKQVQGQGVA